LSSTLAASGALKPDANAVSVLTRFVRYFAAIRFWQDEDSGHWEEQRKVSASSIGTVVAGLEAFADLLRQHGEWWQACGLALDDLASSLAERGRQALDAILPGECAQLVGSKNRRYDAALLFLLFPLGVITDDRATLVREGDMHWDLALPLSCSSHSAAEDVSLRGVADATAQLSIFRPSCRFDHGNPGVICSKLPRD
jgi:hypothetical protein